jgi:Fe2+ or Zn2+ uptake regulation protein
MATGQVIEFASEKLRKLCEEICREHGYDMLSHQFHIFGLSPQAKAEAAKGGAAATRPGQRPISTSR